MRKERASPMKTGKVADVEIKRARNGYVITTTDKKYNVTEFIAKTKAEAKQIAQKLIKI